MKLPSFFDQVPRLRMQDPLADLLGCAEDGVFEYSYGDAVRLAGHSCPTVASAYWLTCLSLKELYPDGLPQRGGVQVAFRETERHGSIGVVASIVQMLTGAGCEGGFKGIAGRFSRAGLRRYAPELPLSMRFTRLDTGCAVDAGVDLSLPAPDPALNALLDRVMAGCTEPDALAELGRRWQERVRLLLIDLANEPAVFMVRRVQRRRWLAVRPAALGPQRRRDVLTPAT